MRAIPFGFYGVFHYSVLSVYRFDSHFDDLPTFEVAIPKEWGCQRPCKGRRAPLLKIVRYRRISARINAVGNVRRPGPLPTALIRPLIRRYRTIFSSGALRPLQGR